MSTPWLSILVPVYGVEGFLPACLDSIRSQALDGVEVRMLDDASPDGSGAIARAAVAQQPGVFALHAHERNRGLSAARNSLLAEARGEYVWFLDSDDLLMPGAVARLAASVQAHAPDLVLCDFRVHRDRPQLKHRLRGEGHRRSFPGDGTGLVRDRAHLLRGLLERGELHAWSKIAKADVWRAAPFPEGRYFEDIAVIPALAGASNSFIHIASPWVAYRQRGDSILGAMSPAKCQHLASSLRDLHLGLRHRPELADPALSAALDEFCLRRFATVAKKLAGADEAVESTCRRMFQGMFPDAGDAALAAMRRRRGGWLRAGRVRRALARAGWRP